MLPDRCVVENIDAIIEAAGIGPSDRAVSWLPLYHDMGLIGLLMTPMLHGFELVLGAPQDFLAAPANWLEWISTFRGTITAGPNFSYALAARALQRAGAGSLDLSSWRLALNGAEPVDPARSRRSARTRPLTASTPRPRSPCSAWPKRRSRSRSRSPVSAWPSITSTARRSSTTGTPPRRRPRARAVDASRCSAAPSAASSCRVVEPESGRVLGEREVGELELRGPSVTPGYYRNDAATAAAFRDGWFRTGDLAYLVDAQLVVCGRLKDMIIVGGRNVFPEDVERVAAAVDGVRAGNVIAFGNDRRKGREAIVVVAETKADDLGAVTGRRGGSRERRRGRASGRDRVRAGRIAAQDVIREAATIPVPPALSRRSARPGLKGAERARRVSHTSRSVRREP